MIKISVITITKNRAGLLAKNLNSLRHQLIKGDEIIIVNNQSTDNTPEIIKNFQELLPIRTYLSGRQGYPGLYNLAISKAKNSTLVFLDDDCIASKKYLTRVRKMREKYPGCVIQGASLGLPKNNIFADVATDHADNWFKKNLYNHKYLTIVDNRNLVLPKKIIAEFGGFSEKLSAGSEDIEYGRRLAAKGVKIIYDRKLVVYHHERDNLRDFLIQRFRIAKTHAIYDAALEKKQRLTVINRQTRSGYPAMILSRFKKYFQEKRIKDAATLIILYLTLSLVRILGYLSGLKIKKQNNSKKTNQKSRHK